MQKDMNIDSKILKAFHYRHSKKVIFLNYRKTNKNNLFYFKETYQ